MVHAMHIVVADWPVYFVDLMCVLNPQLSIYLQTTGVRIKYDFLYCSVVLAEVSRITR